MSYRNLPHFIERLEQEGELLHIKTDVDPVLEIAEITDRISKEPGGGKALLFENTGYPFPVLMNAYGSERRMCLALGVNSLNDVATEMESLFKELASPKESLLDKIKLLPKLGRFASWMPKVIDGKGACQEVIMTQPDITKLPVITCWPQDGGPFVTLPVIHTKDPHTGIRNVGMYRMQVFEPKLTGMHWHRHKVSARHFNEYKKLGKKMPVAVALGGDPVYAYSATAPLPDNVDEYMLAGFLRKKKVELVKCITQPTIEVPADADFIIEGYVDPQNDMIWEGPFGDHTGYYSLPDWYPRFHVTAITHKKNAIYPATIVGIPPQEDAWLGKATERIFLAPIKMTLLPEIEDMDMPIEGVFHNLVLARIKKDYPGQALKTMNAMWGAGQMMFNKILVITSNDNEGKRTPLSNYEDIAREVFAHVNPATDIHFLMGPMDVLDHSCSKMGYGGKMCIDGSYRYNEERDDKYAFAEGEKTIDEEAIMQRFPTVKKINSTLLKKNIPVVLIAVEKSKTVPIRELHKNIFEQMDIRHVKLVLYVEETVDVSDISTSLWRFCNNLDPQRDKILYQKNIEGTHKYTACLGLDGTIKTLDIDGFERDWPNIIVADDKTIEAVDAKWASLQIGDFIPSPSLKFKNQMYGQQAVAAYK